MMVTTFLPIVSNNLPRYIGSQHLYAIIWGISLILLCPKVFMQKIMLLLIVYGFLLGLMLNTFWTNMTE